ncbi:DUF2905 domain-containing protein [Acidobacteriia bacterium AH_259_A11_L15]|nr:DUF2905 domain-containing protein [Acidobacteriia bacterium AH_259_A11_L15]
MAFEPWRELGKLLLVFGLVLVVLGVVLSLGPKLPGKLGRLPGDIIIRRDNFTLYFPLVTCLLLSVIFSLALWLLGRK